MLVLVWCALLWAGTNGLAGGEDRSARSRLMYKTYADAGRYLFDPTPQNWIDASKVCRAYNGHLAFPKTRDEADALWSIMTLYNVNQVHAGFHDQFLEGEYYTAKGSLINETSFNEWSVGAPIGGSSLNCGALRSDGLVDEACGNNLPSICEENEPSGNSGFLDYEWLEGHGYYKQYTSSAAWPDAMRSCYEEGSHLLILNSEAERTAVLSRFNISGTLTHVWVGAHHLFADRYFVTIFDEPLDTTGNNTPWAPNEPYGDNISYPYVAVDSTGYFILGGARVYICEYNPTTCYTT